MGWIAAMHPSTIRTHGKPGQSNIPLGDFLGDMTNELDNGDFITGPRIMGTKLSKGKSSAKSEDRDN